ncbi:MAG: hypothetical protein OXF85_00915 [Candidatus Saccharibacteria bacterium]|nr:hypothetical protein [Candidatus Saccharibacteria bacterium]
MNHKKSGEINGGQAMSEVLGAEAMLGFEVASLEEHDCARLNFIEAKANLLDTLNHKLQEAGCGSLRSLHYQHLLRYVRAVEAYQQDSCQKRSPMLHLECQSKLLYYEGLASLGFKVNASGMNLIHSELAPTVLQTRQTLVEVFERLSEEDQRSLLPQTSIKISNKGFTPVGGIEGNIEIDFWSLKQASLEQDYLENLPVKINRHHPEVYNKRIREAVATEKAYLSEPRTAIFRLVGAYRQHASTEEAVEFFKSQIFEPIFAVCLAARDNGDLQLLRAVGYKLNPNGFLGLGSVGNPFDEVASGLMETDLGGRYAKNYPEDAEYLFYEAEKMETVATDSYLGAV